MNELVGLKILKLYVSPQQDKLVFETNNGPMIYWCSGGCCSETWFSEILNLDFLINNVVNEVVELQMPEYVDGNCRQQEDAFYGYRLATKAGHCTIVFRNSSNGYYGGDCHYDLKCEIKLDHYQDISHLSDWTAYEKTAGSYFNYLKLKAFW